MYDYTYPEPVSESDRCHSGIRTEEAMKTLIEAFPGIGVSLKVTG